MKLATYYLEHPEVLPVDMLNIKFLAVAADINSLTDKLCGAGTIMTMLDP